MSSTRKGKAKKLKVDAHGKVFIQATFNNIIMTITNGNGDVVAWSSAGKMGFRGSKKNTPFAAQMTAEDCGKKVLEAGMAKLDVFIKGPGSGRDAAIRALGTIGFDVQSITDITPLPHNGCRPPKKRRV